MGARGEEAGGRGRGRPKAGSIIVEPPISTYVTPMQD